MDVVTKAHDGNVRMIETSIVRVHQQCATAKRGSRSMWVAPAVGSRPKSMRMAGACVDTAARSALAVAGGFLEESPGAFWKAKRNNLLSGYVVF
jgi:hypothetical protein